jgi:hypothetical protein
MAARLGDVPASESLPASLGLLSAIGSAQVDGGREGHGERDRGVAEVALEHKDQHRDQQHTRGGQPADSGEVHGAILAAGPDERRAASLGCRLVGW